MGRRGPPRKPDEIKRMEGNPGNNKLNDEAPEFELPDFDQDANVTAPADLKDAGRAEWEKLVPMLIMFGVIRKADMTGFHRYCKVLDNIAYYEKLLENIKDELSYIHEIEGGDPSDYIKRLNETQRMLNQMRVQARHEQQEFGITPASRSGIKAKHPKGKQGTNGPAQKTVDNIPTGGNVARFFKRS